ncbi:hypothetical protein CcNV_022 [Crangon crangon nudivirus]|uniref:Uncharacterized protein n=1 Tax=Crangon crangon nudivirus TaxID=2880838 RepID=A0AAE8XZV0_9VIRU|nr:hypothetical protein QKT25_gp022 [Crangon crangon nudivirus]UBZ25506.1 hypothetical protein CcNV_022 [Crangon crangon nudivirus]
MEPEKTINNNHWIIGILVMVVVGFLIFFIIRWVWKGSVSEAPVNMDKPNQGFKYGYDKKNT